MKLGAQLYSVRTFTQTPEGLRNTFYKLKEIGYENVQLSGEGPIAPEAMREIIEETRLPIVCTHSPYDRIVGDTDALIAEHKIIGCPVIGLGYMPVELHGGTEGLKKLLADLAEPVKKIRAAGMNFAYHNHEFEFAALPNTDKTVYDMMLELCPDWHFIMDTYWVEYAGRSAIEYISKIGAGRLVNIHFKDMAKNEERSICPCGMGVLDFEKIFAACQKNGVQNILVEQDNAVKSPDAFADMATSYRHLHPIVHGLC